MSDRDRFASVMASSGTLTAKTEIVFLHTLPACFSGKNHLHAEIARKISSFSRCLSSLIKFCGSAQLGFSPYKNSDFQPGVSDLDAAIISGNLYLNLLEEARVVTNNYTDLTSFSAIDGVATSTKFKSYAVEKGIIHVSSLPICETRERWMKFTNKLTNDYISMFKSISVSVYSTEKAFVRKQISAIYAHLPGKK